MSSRFGGESTAKRPKHNPEASGGGSSSATPALASAATPAAPATLALGAVAAPARGAAATTPRVARALVLYYNTRGRA